MTIPIVGKDVLQNAMRGALVSIEHAQRLLIQAAITLEEQSLDSEAAALQATVADLDLQLAAIVLAVTTPAV